MPFTITFSRNRSSSASQTAASSASRRSRFSSFVRNFPRIALSQSRRSVPASDSHPTPSSFSPSHLHHPSSPHATIYPTTTNANHNINTKAISTSSHASSHLGDTNHNPPLVPNKHKPSHASATDTNQHQHHQHLYEHASTTQPSSHASFDPISLSDNTSVSASASNSKSNPKSDHPSVSSNPPSQRPLTPPPLSDAHSPPSPKSQPDLDLGSEHSHPQSLSSTHPSSVANDAHRQNTTSPSLQLTLRDNLFLNLSLPYSPPNAAPQHQSVPRPPQNPAQPPAVFLSTQQEQQEQYHHADDAISVAQSTDTSQSALAHPQSSAQPAQTATQLSNMSQAFAQNSEVAMISAVRRRCVQWHDYNSNTLLLITLNDESPTSSRQSSTTRDGNAPITESVVHESDGDDSDDNHSQESDFEPSDVSDDDDNDDDDECDRHDIIKRLRTDAMPDAIECALAQSKNLSMSPEHLDDVMTALDIAVDKLDTSASAPPLHPDIRIEVHHALAQFFARKGSSFRDRSLKHCDRGLLLLHGRQRHFPQFTAELHLLKANLMLGYRARRRMRDVFEHIRAARVALAACKESFGIGPHFELYVTTGFAHSVCTAHPVCEHLLAAYDAYMSAIELVRLGPDESSSSHWMHLVCVAAQLAVRFLRHRRVSLVDALSPCHGNASSACRLGAARGGNGEVSKSGNGGGDVWIGRPHVRLVDIDSVLAMVDDVKQRLSDMMDSSGGAENYDLEQRLSVAHECVGRCYLERSYGHVIKNNSNDHGEEGGEERGRRRRSKAVIQDVKKACVALQRALWSCEWSDDYAGQRYVTLSELLESCRHRLQRVEQCYYCVEGSSGDVPVHAHGREDEEEDDDDDEIVEEWDDSYWDEIVHERSEKALPSASASERVGVVKEEEMEGNVGGDANISTGDDTEEDMSNGREKEKVTARCGVAGVTSDKMGVVDVSASSNASGDVGKSCTQQTER